MYILNKELVRAPEFWASKKVSKVGDLSRE